MRRYVDATGPFLDFGCGTGHLVRRMAAFGRTAGFETSEHSAAQATSTAPGCDIYTTMSDIPDSSFSGITAIHVLEHLADDLAAESLETWRRALVAGGRVLVVVPNPAGHARRLKGEQWIGYSDPTHINLKRMPSGGTFCTITGSTPFVRAVTACGTLRTDGYRSWWTRQSILDPRWRSSSPAAWSSSPEAVNHRSSC